MGTVTKKQKNVPTLRFNQNSEQWDFVLLDSVTTRGSGHTPSKSRPEYYKGNIPWISLADSDKLDAGIINDSKTYITELGIRNSSAVLHPAGTVLLSRDAGIGKSAVMGKDMAVSQHFITWKCSEKLNNWYLYYFLQKRKPEFERMSVGSTIKTIGLPYFKKLHIHLPPRIEQDKIASFLVQVDAWLNNLRQQKSALEIYKRGMMQKLFTQQVRFKDEFGKNFPEWQEKKLSDVLNYKQPTEFIVDSTEYSDEYTTPVLTAGKSFILGYTNETKGIYKYELPVIIFDDFTTATQFVDFPFKVKSSAMKILVPLDGNDIRFIYEAMQGIRFEVGGHGRQWISKYSKQIIAVPSLDEQKKIADFADSMTKLVADKSEEISKVEQWKKGLMQKMFV